MCRTQLGVFFVGVHILPCLWFSSNSLYFFLGRRKSWLGAHTASQPRCKDDNLNLRVQYCVFLKVRLYHLEGNSTRMSEILGFAARGMFLVACGRCCLPRCVSAPRWVLVSS